MPELGVNIDHVATVRQARRTYEPDPVWAAALAELGGADGITLHLREDRRHINDRDFRLLKETVFGKLNLEMAAADEIIAIAHHVKPHTVCLVPENRQEVTTEGGLDVAGNRERMQAAAVFTARLYLTAWRDSAPFSTSAGSCGGKNSTWPCSSKTLSKPPSWPGWPASGAGRATPPTAGAGCSTCRCR